MWDNRANITHSIMNYAYKIIFFMIKYRSSFTGQHQDPQTEKYF